MCVFTEKNNLLMIALSLLLLIVVDCCLLFASMSKINILIVFRSWLLLTIFAIDDDRADSV